MSEFQSVVLTGLGAITSHGDWTLGKGSTPFGGDEGAFGIENFALENYLASQKTYLDRCSALALAGCALALRDAEISLPIEEERFGITLGTHFGCIETMKSFWDKALEKGARLANPLLFSHSYFNSPISLCAIEFSLKGYHATLCSNENSGGEAVRAAFDAIRLGHADAMICGGVDAISPTRILCAPDEKAGEAAVFFVLENAAHAQSRGKGSTPCVEESLFEIGALDKEIKARLGNCGGAQTALALAQKAMSLSQI